MGQSRKRTREVEALAEMETPESPPAKRLRSGTKTSGTFASPVKSVVAAPESSPETPSVPLREVVGAKKGGRVARRLNFAAVEETVAEAVDAVEVCVTIESEEPCPVGSAGLLPPPDIRCDRCPNRFSQDRCGAIAANRGFPLLHGDNLYSLLCDACSNTGRMSFTRHHVTWEHGIVISLLNIALEVTHRPAESWYTQFKRESGGRLFFAMKYIRQFLSDHLPNMGFVRPAEKGALNTWFPVATRDPNVPELQPQIRETCRELCKARNVFAEICGVSPRPYALWDPITMDTRVTDLIRWAVERQGETYIYVPRTPRPNFVGLPASELQIISDGASDVSVKRGKREKIVLVETTTRSGRKTMQMAPKPVSPIKFGGRSPRKTAEEFPAPTAPETDYERARQEKILENKRMLAELGLGTGSLLAAV